MQVTTRRRVVDQDDAEKLLDDWEDSKLEFRAFCGREQVDGRSLQCWRTNLGRRSSNGPEVQPVNPRQAYKPGPLGRRPSNGPEVQLVELTLASSHATRAAYRLVVGAVSIEVDDDFQEDTLARLLGVVARC